MRCVFSKLSQSIWRRAEYVVANSEGLRYLALAAAPEQAIRVIPKGVDTEAFIPRTRAEEDEPRPEGLRVLCVSRLIERKGIEYLIRAVAMHREKRVHLMLVGTGNQKSVMSSNMCRFTVKAFPPA